MNMKFNGVNRMLLSGIDLCLYRGERIQGVKRATKKLE